MNRVSIKYHLHNIDIGILTLRIFISYTMKTLHALPKWNKLASNNTTDFPDPLGLGQFVSLVLAFCAEFFCSILLIIGYKTKYVVIPLIVTMIIATWIVNGGRPLIFKEKSLLYLFSYFALLFFGSGESTLLIRS